MQLFWELNQMIHTKDLSTLGHSKCSIKYTPLGACLVAQWLRIRLPMQGTQVRALAREDPTCHGGAKPVRHNY